MINSKSEVNAITLTFAVKLGLVILKTDFGSQKIDGLLLVTYGMILADFSVQDKLGKVQFFEKTFLLANTSIKMVLKMLFLTFSDVDMQFGEKKLK